MLDALHGTMTPNRYPFDGMHIISADSNFIITQRDIGNAEEDIGTEFGCHRGIRPESRIGSMSSPTAVTEQSKLLPAIFVSSKVIAISKVLLKKLQPELIISNPHRPLSCGRSKRQSTTSDGGRKR